ncbi:hypothetical protein DPMN_051448 [Dreissena polymorpha]|uniref:Uncharacterized protein n=1 Tax=Dreissena polymorpha TaxID=45954 RepID=A0A9D4CJC6_DREPO|nr:hypothetical protein DPMN_051448 [Dreissena polymorpha]
MMKQNAALLEIQEKYLKKASWTPFACRFHNYNCTRPSWTVPAGSTLPDDALYARPPNPRTPLVSYRD